VTSGLKVCVWCTFSLLSYSVKRKDFHTFKLRSEIGIENIYLTKAEYSICLRCSYTVYMYCPTKQLLYYSFQIRVYRSILTINVPVVFMARYLMILRGATSLRGALEGVGPEN
jgi:hypothetical protein